MCKLKWNDFCVCLALRSLLVCLGKLLVLDGGVGFLGSLPVDGLVVAAAVHGVDLAVLVGVGQGPCDS